MRLIFLSHTAMGGAFVVGSHQLATVLSRDGHEVTHIGAAVSPAHLLRAFRDPFVLERFRRWFRGGRRFGNVIDIAPLTALPWGLAKRTRRSMNAYSSAMLSSPFATARSAGISTADRVIVDDPRFVGIAREIPSSRLIYRATDLYAAMRNDSKVLDAERSICAHAGLLIATSARVAEHLQRLSGKRVHVIANGVDFEHFAGSSCNGVQTGLRLPGQPADRAVYVGAFDQRFGAEALRQAVEQLPDKSFILIGPGSKEFAAELRLSNLTGLGPISYGELPPILQRCRVGLLPMSAHASNDGRSPMKFYEYAAAGLCVAASTTHELRRRTLPTLFLAESDLTFPATVSRAFHASTSIQHRLEARAIAQAESWHGKAQLLVQLMQSAGKDAAGIHADESPASLSIMVHGPVGHR